MKYSYNWLKELFPDLPPPKETAELLTIHAFETEEPVRMEGDWLLELDILPNRMADASSHEGLARELSAIVSVQHQSKRSLAPVLAAPRVSEDPDVSIDSSIRLRIEDRDGCSRYAVRVIEGVRVGPSPASIQKRLRICGIEPINNVVDAVNYVMLETGQPLHAFDLDRISSMGNPKSEIRNSKQILNSKQVPNFKSQIPTIIVRKARAGEKITTLDGQEREMLEGATVIADAKHLLAIAGIKGGMKAAIASDTKVIVIEAALFSREMIYRTSRALDLTTDASRRFAAGRSGEDLLRSIDRAAELVIALSGGKALRGTLIGGAARKIVRSIPFSPSRALSFLGISLTNDDAFRALSAIGCTIRQRKVSRSATASYKLSAIRFMPIWAVTPPHDRFDLEREEDLFEEVGRLLGYHVIPGELPFAPLSAVEVPTTHYWSERARDMFANLGFHELMRLSFLNKSLLVSFGFQTRGLVTLANPQSEDLDTLRPSLLPRLLLAAAQERRKRDSVQLFEIGAVFTTHARGGVRERMKLGCVLVNRSGTSRVLQFYELKGACEELFISFGLSDVRWRPVPFAGTRLDHQGGRPLKAAESSFHSARSAEVSVGDERVGIVGELSPSVQKDHALLEGCAVAELDLEVLARLATQEHEYKVPSRFPEMLRDISVLVPRDVLADDVNECIATAGGSLVRDVELFDYFEGEHLADDMKSLAFHILYQSDRKTLSSAEVDRAQNKIVSALQKKGWEIR